LKATAKEGKVIKSLKKKAFTILILRRKLKMLLKEEAIQKLILKMYREV